MADNYSEEWHFTPAKTSADTENDTKPNSTKQTTDDGGYDNPSIYPKIAMVLMDTVKLQYGQLNTISHHGASHEVFEECIPLIPPWDSHHQACPQHF